MTRRKYIKHTTEAEARERVAAIDVAMGYPAAATRRGANCPPHPFGETTTFARVVRSGDDWATPEAPARVVGRVERVDSKDVEISNDGATELDDVADEPVIVRAR